MSPLRWCKTAVRFYEEPPTKGMTVTTHPGAVEGLEFVLVVLIDQEAFCKGIEGVVDRYVAMTRATQRLVILTSS